MANQKKIKKTGIVPRISKEVKDFLMDDEGKIQKKDIVRLGVSLAMLGMVAHAEAGGSCDQCGGHSDSGCNIKTDKHSNALVNNDKTGGTGCFEHANQHVSHCQHDNHSEGGWC